VSLVRNLGHFRQCHFRKERRFIVDNKILHLLCKVEVTKISNFLLPSSHFVVQFQPPPFGFLLLGVESPVQSVQQFKLDKQILSKLVGIIPRLRDLLYWYCQRIHHTSSTINHYVGSCHIATKARSKKPGYTANLDWQASSFKPYIFPLCLSNVSLLYQKKRGGMGVFYLLGLQE